MRGEGRGQDIVTIPLPTGFQIELIPDEFRDKEVDGLESGFWNKKCQEEICIWDRSSNKRGGKFSSFSFSQKKKEVMKK